jgi:methionyl-tRNA formyltransferase
MGTPEFAVPSLELLAARYDVAAVFTQPDRPSGRGQKLAQTPVKRAALALNLPVHEPLKITATEVLHLLESLAADAMVVVGYGKLIPQVIIDMPPLGIINLHASLLPKYRGAAPINWALVRGESQTGVTTMKIDAGLDTGNMLLKETIDIAPDDDTVTLGRKLAAIGAPLLARTLDGLERGEITPIPQDDGQATLAPALRKEDGRADWTLSAVELLNRVRGFAPWPGVYTKFREGTLNIWRAAAAEPSTAALGTLTVAGRRVFVACGNGSLELLEVQPEGKKRMPAADFLNGARVQAGESLR